MRIGGALAIAAVAGIASSAAAQVTLPEARMTYTLNWTNAATGAREPLKPGQSANLTLTVEMSPPPRTPGQWLWTLVPGGGYGTYRGIQSIFNDLIGTATSGGEGAIAGTWSNLTVNPRWDITGAGQGTPDPGGARLRNIRAGQFPTNPNAGTNSTNPIVDVWSGTWTPGTYSDRTVIWSVANGTANPNTQANSIIIRDASAPTTVYIGRGHDAFGGASIQIIPGPSSLSLLGLGGLIAIRRRRA